MGIEQDMVWLYGYHGWPAKHHQQSEMLRRNISTGSSSSLGSRTGKTQGCQMRTEAMTRGTSFATTHSVTVDAHSHRDASINSSDMDKVGPDDCVPFQVHFSDLLC